LNILSKIRIPRCEFGDKIAIARLCAHYYFDLEETIEKYTFCSFESTFSEKLHFFRLKNPKNYDLSWNSDRKQAEKLAYLISDLFRTSLNPIEQLLLSSKVLKLSIKQIFQLCVPELFYRLLIIGGNLLKNGEDFSNVSLEYSITTLIFS
jgi:hypothetical protein